MSATYKLVTLHSPGWSANDAATLLISVGQPYHESEKFAATVEWANRHFERLHILVADTLQRHNAPGDWREAGRGWVERNRASWALSSQITLSHWDEWLGAAEFLAVMGQFRACATGLLEHAIARDAAGFAERRAAKGLLANVVQSRGYLIEELAVITLQARVFPGARLYPGPQLECFRLVASGLVENAPRGLERQYHTVIDFKRRRPSLNSNRPASLSTDQSATLGL